MQNAWELRKKLLGTKATELRVEEKHIWTLSNHRWLGDL